MQAIIFPLPLHKEGGMYILRIDATFIRYSRCGQGLPAIINLVKEEPMNPRIGLSIFLITAVIVNLQAATNTPIPHTENNLNVSQDIKPNDRQKYNNGLWFEVGANCKINTYQQQVHLKLELKNSYAVINGKKYKSPHIIESYEVNDSDKFNVQVGKKADVAITLLQEGNTKKIKADCSVSV